VDRRQDGVHAAAASNHGNVGASAAQIRHHDNLILDLGLRAPVIGEHRSDGFTDELQHLEVGGGGGSDQGSFLLVGEVRGDGDNGRRDLLAKVLGGRADQAAEVTGGNLRDGQCRRGCVLALLVLDGERDGLAGLLRVGRGVVVRRVDRLELFP
jgi:hypothetical protein